MHVDSNNAVVARETYSPGAGRKDEWVHRMPQLGEIVIRTSSANWHLSVTEDGHLQVRVINLPAEPALRAVIKADSSNTLTIESRYLGT